ncbi:MAG TPA: TonB-dependent receptor, partial [Rhodanobacteraceae bacterium]|nr:TonB-dependent receptor [Rhodanobacteraceae bacterium]
MFKQVRLTVPKPTLLACALAGCLALSATHVFAQSTAATLRGQATAGAEITATNADTGLVRRVTATSEGNYTMAGLPPGTYSVQVAGGESRTVTLSVAQTATLDLSAAASAAEATTLEGVTVIGTILPEVKTSEVGGTVSTKIINTIPQVTRNFLEFADVVPGVAFSVDPGNGTTKLQGGAQSASAINVYIDGVGQKNYVLQGGITGQDSSRGNPFPQLGIAEYKVITQNYKAEYDQLSSAAVTAITKSGTNEFHGEVYGQYTDQDWRAKTPAENHAHEKKDTQEKDYGAALGGPILKDVMHFFLTYEAKDYVTPVTVVPGTPIPGPLPPEAEAQIGPTSIPFHQDLYFGKIDWTPGEADLIELSARYRKEAQRDNVGGTQVPAFGSDIVNDEKRVDLRWQHTADRWLNDGHVTWEDTSWGPRPINNGIAQIFSVKSDNNRVILDTGAGANFQDKGQEGPAIQDDLSFTDLHWNGDHLVKTGFKYKEAKLSTQEINPANPQFFYNVTAEGADSDPYRAIFGVPLAGIGDGTAESKNKQFGIYLQDDWAVNEKLTLNLGVRWDYEKTPSYLDYVTPADVVAAFNSQDLNAGAPAGQTYAQTLALGGIDINDYISTGHNRDAQTDEWQPRVGFSYDLNGDQEHVFFGGAGRAYDRDSFDYLQLELSKATFPSYEVFFNSPNGQPCDPTQQANCFDFNPSFYDIDNLRALVSSTGGGREIDLLNNNLKVPYSDQFSIGMRNVVHLGRQDWNTSVTLSRIQSRDGFAFILGNRRPDGSFFGNGNPDYGLPFGFPIPGFGAAILGKNGIESNANSVLIGIDKPYTKDSGWGVTIAYTYVDAKENRKFGEHYSLDEPDISDYPFILSHGASKHRLVATGIYDGPWGTTFSSKLTLATPIPYSDIACVPDAAFPCFPSAIHAPGSGRFLFGGPIFGTRQLDFAVNKDFDMTGGVVLYVRADLINAFNWKNYSDYN